MLGGRIPAASKAKASPPSPPYPPLSPFYMLCIYYMFYVIRLRVKCRYTLLCYLLITNKRFLNLNLAGAFDHAATNGLLIFDMLHVNGIEGTDLTLLVLQFAISMIIPRQLLCYRYTYVVFCIVNSCNDLMVSATANCIRQYVQLALSTSESPAIYS